MLTPPKALTAPTTPTTLKLHATLQAPGHLKVITEKPYNKSIVISINFRSTKFRRIQHLEHIQHLNH